MKYLMTAAALLATPLAQGETYILDKGDYVINLDRNQDTGGAVLSFLPGGMSNYQVTLSLLVNEPPYPMNWEIYGGKKCVVMLADQAGKRKPQKGEAAIRVQVKEFKACFQEAGAQGMQPSDFSGIFTRI